MPAVYGVKEGEAAATQTQQEGKYRVLVELGQGGTANVFLAVARGPAGFNKLVVLKALKRNLGDDPEFRNMFLNEARLAARLNHPNIVQANEVAEDLGVPIIVMEYLEGQPLSNVLIRGRGGALTLPMHLRIIADALNGLHAAHELNDYDGTALGVVHRDMTPHNVFVTFDGQVKVLDFGIAKLNASLVETQAGIMKGKLRYMPPEQIAGHSVDRRADIYAVGVMLWEAAAGERLWKGQADAAIMHKVVNGEIPSPRTVNPDVPAALEAICMKALSPKREDRFESALALEQAIDVYIAELGAPVTNRAIGKMVATLFADVRVKTKSMIDEQLSRVASLTWAEYQASQEAFNAPTMTLSNLTASSTITGGSMSGHTSTPSKKWPGAAALVIAAVGITGVLFIWKSSSNGDGRPAEPVSAAPAPRTEPTDKARTPDRVLVRLSATPAEAKLFFDDEPLPANPLVRTMPADGAQHVVRAEAAGFGSNSAVIVLDKDAEVVLNLEHLNKSSSASSQTQNNPTHGRQGPQPSHNVTAPQPAPAPVAPAPPTVPKADCNPPYYLDSHGIKKYKPECT